MSFGYSPSRDTMAFLENLPNNNRSIEIQLLKRFVESTNQLVLPEEYHDEFSSIFRNKRVVGTLSQCVESTVPQLTHDQHYHLPKFFQRSVLMDDELAQLKELYSDLLQVPASTIDAPNSYRKYQQIIIDGKLFGSAKSRSASSIIMAVRHPTSEIRAAQVHFYAQHTIVVGEQSYSFLLFYPVWFKPHQQHSLYGKPVTMWEPDCYESSDTYNLLPVQFMRSRTVSLIDMCALSKSDSNSCNETVLLVCPIVE